MGRPKQPKHKAYNKDWETMSECRGWLTPSSKFQGWGYCRWCKSDMRPHLADLKRHATTAKHLDKKRARLLQPSIMDTSSAPTLTQAMKKRRRELR